MSKKKLKGASKKKASPQVTALQAEVARLRAELEVKPTLPLDGLSQVALKMTMAKKAFHEGFRQPGSQERYQAFCEAEVEFESFLERLSTPQL